MVRAVTEVIVPRPTLSEIGMVCTVTEEIAPSRVESKERRRQTNRHTQQNKLANGKRKKENATAAVFCFLIGGV